MASFQPFSMEVIQKSMVEQYDSSQFMEGERFNCKILADMKRRQGESVQELADRSKHDAVMCDFSQSRTEWVKH